MHKNLYLLFVRSVRSVRHGNAFLCDAKKVFEGKHGHCSAIDIDKCNANNRMPKPIAQSSVRLYFQFLIVIITRSAGGAHRSVFCNVRLQRLNDFNCKMQKRKKQICGISHSVVEQQLESQIGFYLFIFAFFSRFNSIFACHSLTHSRAWNFTPALALRLQSVRYTVDADSPFISIAWHSPSSVVFIFLILFSHAIRFPIRIEIDLLAFSIQMNSPMPRRHSGHAICFARVKQ